MSAPTTISRRGRAGRAANFERLRAEGMAHVQALSGQTWTDHNLHDPGVTILEQLCYALTELVYRADFEVADHLTGPDGSIKFDALSLHRPRDVFPCRATTVADYRRVLLDQVPGLDDAALLQRKGSAAGVHTLQLNLAQITTPTRGERSKLALAAYRAQRNLGEDVEPQAMILHDHWCELDAEIEIGGPREAAEILADVYDAAARFIDRAASFSSLGQLRGAGRMPEDLYDGPYTPHGVESGQPRRGGERLYAADVAAQVRRIDGVREVRSLTLSMAESSARPGPLEWGTDEWALCLRVPFEVDNEPAHQGSNRVRILRRGQPLQITSAELRRRYEDLQASYAAQHSAGVAATDSDAAGPLPSGRWRPPTPYYSVQHHFPPVYGLGPHGVPPSAGTLAQAKSRQLASYLLLCEQIIANGAAQLEHLRELFSVNGGSGQSYWWQTLTSLRGAGDAMPNAEDPPGPPQVPGLKGLFIGTTQTIEREVFEAFDRSPQRKQRVLDHLLALHGESYTQNAMRQFWGHLSEAEADELLLANKTAYLADIVRLGQDRAAGFDYGKPSWDVAGNCSMVVRRSCLLLGFAQAHSRPLCRMRQRIRLPAELGAAVTTSHIDEARLAERRPVDFGAVEPGEVEAQLEQDLEAIAPRGQPAPDRALLSRGAQRGSYVLLPADGPDSDKFVLALGPDSQGHWRQLGGPWDMATASRYAAVRRALLLQLDNDSEGLHVVEHVLLRPLGKASSDHAELVQREDFRGLRLTVVLPNWTVRTGHEAFRQLAEETVRLNCPAHLVMSFLWLDFEALAEFEKQYGLWLRARLEHCQDKVKVAASEVDEAACRVIRRILPHAREARVASTASPRSSPAAGPRNG